MPPKRKEIELSDDVKEESKSKKKLTTSVTESKVAFRTVHEELCKVYGKPRRRTEGNSMNACGKKETVLRSLIGLILSQNTSDKNSSSAQSALFKRFPKGLDQIRKAPVTDIEDAIRHGGLAKTKANRIKELLQDVYAKYGETSLESYRNRDTEEIKRELSTEFKGLGPKSISCMLMFTLERDEFPVDTHVHRLCSRLGWVQGVKDNREKTYALLNPVIPDALKYDLHVLLIKHGRQVCHSQTPDCARCPLQADCNYFKSLGHEASTDSIQTSDVEKQTKAEEAHIEIKYEDEATLQLPAASARVRSSRSKGKAMQATSIKKEEWIAY
eukprot:TRINITY_DN6267_c0_g1_i1.p1 TRINITY_DN6267_c0_g1~~TRINITY_DN6267_c0_g1_i1.p1  ORF type:complete len:328 (-),score=69.05 TRINITY_DN6267_c0_g1_i1:280-1263(-)